MCIYIYTYIYINTHTHTHTHTHTQRYSCMFKHINTDTVLCPYFSEFECMMNYFEGKQHVCILYLFSYQKRYTAWFGEFRGSMFFYNEFGTPDMLRQKSPVCSNRALCVFLSSSTISLARQMYCVKEALYASKEPFLVSKEIYCLLWRVLCFYVLLQWVWHARYVASRNCMC